MILLSVVENSFFLSRPNPYIPIAPTMNRRTFIKLSSLALAGILTQSCDSTSDNPNPQSYDISINSDMRAGHLLLNSAAFPAGDTFSTDYLIVGGGISGLSAACQLQDRDFVLCELSAQLGGTSASESYAGEVFSQGAHYDLAYPNYYGGETLNFLEELGVIRYDNLVDSWNFVDRQYLIDVRREGQTLTSEGMREDILEPSQLRTEFLELLLPYLGEMRQPTRMIREELWTLDEISFLDFLKRALKLNSSFKQGVDYQMRDDYGADAGTVSALAGIHYYTCRPYYTQFVELFSPPEGNAYFVDKMAATLPIDRIKTSHLVKRVQKNENGFEVLVVNLENSRIDRYLAKNVIYAGGKHALKYVFPCDAHLFQDNIYAPWLVLNIVLKDDLQSEAFWQNELLGQDSTYMGFVDSASQFRATDARVFTAYYCFPPDQRAYLANIQRNAQEITRETVMTINRFFDQDVGPLAEKVFFKVLGHAMPVPKPHYLFRDKNPHRSERNLVYAGVDNSRLPLLFEALDSGIQAVKELDGL